MHIVFREYGCVRCQVWHREPAPIFQEHLMFQSKHGWREVDVYEAIVETRLS